MQLNSSYYAPVIMDSCRNKLNMCNNIKKHTTMFLCRFISFANYFLWAIAVEQPCQPMWLMRHSTYLSGHTVTMSGVTATTCLGACLKDTSCQSVDYKLASGECAINSNRDDLQNPITVTDGNWDYYEFLCSGKIIFWH